MLVLEEGPRGELVINPIMTDGLYTSVVNMENRHVNQTYKKVMWIDQAFKSADIFIDEKNNTAHCHNQLNTL